MRISLILIAILTVALLSFWSLDHRASAAGIEPGTPCTKAGWWIKVNTEKTEATSVDFQIGTKREDRESWRAWHSSDATEFDVPDKFLKVAHIYIQATANPAGKHAWLCLMYKDHGAQHLDFDNQQEQEKNQNDVDSECK